MWQVHYEARGIETLTAKDRNDSLRDGLAAMGLRHRRRNLPVHFTKRGYSLYGYAKRHGDSGGNLRGRAFRSTYQGRKLRLFGHTLPLVYTGELRRLTLYGLPRVTATARSGVGKVLIHLPAKANFRRGDISPLRELQAVAGMELVDLEKFLVPELERQWRRRGARKSSAGVTIKTQ